MLDWNLLRQNPSNQTTPSGYVWPQYEVKKSFNNVLQFTSKKEQIIHRLSQIWIYLSSRDFDIDPNITENEIKKRHSPDETNIHIAPMLSTKSMFEMIWLDKNSLKAKKITDIWWWFTALPFELQGIVSSLEIVDPCFGWNTERLIDKDIEYLEKNLQSTNESIKVKENSIKELTKILNHHLYDNTPNWQSRYLKLDKQIKETQILLEKIKKNISIKIQVIDELKMWKERIKQWKLIKNDLWFQNTNLNGSVWEDIKWVADNSQDIVFINHLLTKPNVNPYLILSEASRITKRWWEIIVVNDITDWRELFENCNLNVNSDNIKHKIWFRIIKR